MFGSSEVPYAAVAELLREACGIPEAASPEQTREQLRGTLARLVRAPDRRQSLTEALEPVLIASTSAGNGMRSGDSSGGPAARDEAAKVSAR